MDKLYLVCPAYNEQENIEDVVTAWYPVVEQTGAESRMVVMDDGSKDATYEILCRLAKTRPQLVPLHKENSGHGATLLYGYHYALKEGADYIFQTDSDGQTLPAEFAEFWKLRKEYDMIIGHRKGRQDGISRVFVTKVLKLVCLLSFHVRLTDANTPFRLMKAESLKKEIDVIPKDYNLSNVIISVLFAKKGYRVKYLPITFRPRQGGVNSINMKRILKIGRQAWKDFAAINKIIEK